MTLYFTSTPHYNKLAPWKSSAACGAASGWTSTEQSALCCGDAPPCIVLFCFPARDRLGYQIGIFALSLVMRCELSSTICCLLTQCQWGEEGNPHEGKILPQLREGTGRGNNTNRGHETVIFFPATTSLGLYKNKTVQMCLCANVLMTHRRKSGRFACAWAQSH